MPMPVEVRHSARRTRTISWQIIDGRIVIQMPQAMSAEDQARWIAEITQRAEARLKRAERATDADLLARARALARAYLDNAPVRSAVWMRAETRWGSCTPDTGAIRLNERLAAFPDWVLDYVIVHELAHLYEANHSSRFWALVDRYPYAERARGFLLGVQHATNWRPDDEMAPPVAPTPTT